MSPRFVLMLMYGVTFAPLCACGGDTTYPLLLARLAGANPMLQPRQKRHTPLDTTKLCKAFGCKNGYCKESELRNFRIVCECFAGFRGTLCDRLQCPYSCGKHGRCVKDGRGLRCQCNTGYFGLTCNKVVSVETALVPVALPSNKNGHLFPSLSGMIIPTTFRTNRPVFKVTQLEGWFGNSISSRLSDIKFSDFHSHAVIDTSVKPDECAPGFKCYHGNCDRKALNEHNLYQCICKPDYTGLFCDKRCSLKCKNGGKCLVLDDGHQICSCKANFNGHFCEKPRLYKR